MPSMRLDRTSGDRAHLYRPALSTLSRSPPHPRGALPDVPWELPLTSHVTPQAMGPTAVLVTMTSSGLP